MFSSGSNPQRQPSGKGDRRPSNGAPPSSSRAPPSSTAQATNNGAPAGQDGHRAGDARPANARPRPPSSSSSSPPPNRPFSHQNAHASSSRPSQPTPSNTHNRTQHSNAVASSSKPTPHRLNPSQSSAPAPPVKKDAPVIDISSSDSDDNQPAGLQKKAFPLIQPGETISLLSEDDEEPKLVASTQKKASAPPPPRASSSQVAGSSSAARVGGMFWNGGGDKRKRVDPPARRGVSGTGPRRRPPSSSDEDSTPQQRPHQRPQKPKPQVVKRVVQQEREVIVLSDDSDDDTPPAKKAKVSAPAPAPARRPSTTSSSNLESPTQDVPQSSPIRSISPPPAQPRATKAASSSASTFVSKPASAPNSIPPAASTVNASAGPSKQRVASSVSIPSTSPLSTSKIPVGTSNSNQHPQPASSNVPTLASNEPSASSELNPDVSSYLSVAAVEKPSELSSSKVVEGRVAVSKESTSQGPSKGADDASADVENNSPMDVDKSSRPEVVSSSSNFSASPVMEKATSSAGIVLRSTSPSSSPAPLPASAPSTSLPEAGTSDVVVAPRVLSSVAQGKQREIVASTSTEPRRTVATIVREPSEPASEVVKSKSRSPSKSKEPSPVVAAQVVASISPAFEASTSSTSARTLPTRSVERSSSKPKQLSFSQHASDHQPEASSSSSKPRPWAKESDPTDSALIISSPAKVKSPSPDSSDSDASDPSPPPVQTQKARKRPNNGPQGLTTARKNEALAAQRSASSSSSEPSTFPRADPNPPRNSTSPPPSTAQASSVPSPSPAQSGPSNPSVPPDDLEDDADADFDLDALMDRLDAPSPVASSATSERDDLLAMLYEDTQDEDETEDAPSLQAASRMDEDEEEEESDDDEDDIWLQAIDNLDTEESLPDLRTTFQSLPLDESLPDLPAEPIPAAVAELMNRQPRWVYLSNPKNTKEIFEAMILEASTETELMLPPPIKAINEIDPHLEPCPKFEFGYVNCYTYGKNVPRAQRGIGCGCVGVCNPRSTTCRCALKQRSLNPENKVGFAYDESGRLRHINTAIVECCENCECDEDCTNRVAQRGRTFDVEIFKTLEKGWGVRANEAIPADRFLAIYSGELISSVETDARGIFYDKVGRTYLFDLDFSQTKAMAEEFQPKKFKKEKKGKKKKKVVEEDEEEDLGAKWTVDAFHAGFTRYFNHSCDPNLRLEPVFYNDYDPEKPFLAFFSRRAIKKGEELCFAYHGGIDDEEVPEDEVQTRPPGQLRDEAAKTPKKKGAASVAIIADEGAGGEVVIENYEQECKCGARNCKKSMFKLSAGLSLDDDASDSDTDSSEYESGSEDEDGMGMGMRMGEGGVGVEVGKGGEMMVIDEE